jgi:hypothetical protein
MVQLRRGKRWLGSARKALLGLLLAAWGCLRFVHSVKPPPAEIMTTCAQVPRDCRSHVYIFLVHGMDPCDVANLSGLHKYILSLGFSQVYLGQMYHVGQLRDTLLRIHKEDASAHSSDGQLAASYPGWGS